MSDLENRGWRLRSRPTKLIEESNFEWFVEPVPALGEGEFLVRNVYVSLDPTDRIWVTDVEQYMPPVGIGEVMRSGTVGVVERSRTAAYRPGEFVTGLGGWQEYFIASEETGLAKLEPREGVPLKAFMGLLGAIGATAYFGLLDVGRPKEGETLVVDAAAGAVGSIAAQIGKIKGCRVVGIAGSDEKCAWLTGELGLDAAINYKTEDVGESLAKHCPKGIDVVFENVGGPIFDAILNHINLRARIALCGLISTYNRLGGGEAVPGPYGFANILMKRARCEGFIVIDYLPRFPEAMEALAGWYEQGKLQYRVDVVEGLENAPRAVNKLFDGSNMGKLILQVADEPQGA